MGLLFKNNAETTLSSGINNSTTTVPVASAAVFPTPDANNVFFATIEEGNNIEVVKVTGISSNDLTVVRAQDNTSAAAFNSGAKIELRLTAKILEMGTSSLTDLDGDTKIEVEATADSDTIALTSNSGDFSFINSSNTIAFVKTDNNDFTIQNNLNDKDFILKGYDSDGGGLITALSIDYSDQGNATFNKNVIFPDNGKALFGAGTDLAIFSDGTDGKIQATGSLILDADSTTISLRDGGTENSQIGLDSAGLVMTVVGADKDFFISGNDGGSAITGVRVDFSDAGAIICNGNITAFGNTSDIKLKENIEVIPNALDKVKQLKGITFNYKKDGKVSTGLIAQDLEKVLPEAVYESCDIDNDEDKQLAIRYGNTVGLLVEAIKELEARVKELEDK